MCGSILLLSVSLFHSPADAAPSFEDRELIAALIEAMDDPDIEIRQNLAVAVARLGDVAVPALIRALDFEKPERRSGAAIALSQIRPAPKSAIPALLKAVRDKDENVRRHASYALSRIVGRTPMVGSDTDSRPIVPPLDPVPRLDK